MQRKALGIIGLCCLILVAIGFGYWDMLNSEKLRIADENGTVSPGAVKAGAPLQTEAAGSAAAPAANGEAASSADPGAQRARPSDRVTASASDVPSFDILRVEPGGDAVIAGNAAPGSRVAIVDGDQTLGEATATGDGQFAVVVEAPLTPGDHSIALRATDDQGRSMQSEQTAIVSVPTDKVSGEVLAMIDSPGTASRIVEMPKAAAPNGGGEASHAAIEGSPTAPIVQPGSRLPDVVFSTSPDRPSPALPGNGTASDQVADGKGARPNADPAGSTADTDGPSDAAIVAAPETDAGSVAEATAAGAAAPDGTPSRDLAAAGSSPIVAPTAGAATANSVPALRVEAVEVQGRTVSVAGAASSGARVRVYVDNALIAEDRASDNDRFLASGEADLSIGDHLVRADQLGPAGRVVARAEVPFDRTEGERVAAIAPGDGQPGGAAQPEATAAGTLERAANQTAGDSCTNAGSSSPGTAVRGNSGIHAPASASNGSNPSEAVASAEKTNRFAAPDAANGPTVSSTSQDRRAASGAGEGVGGRADQAVEAAVGAPTQNADLPEAPRGTPGETAVEGGDTGSVPATAASSEPASPTAAASGARAPDDDLAPGLLNRQAALTAVDGRVIIRRGDTLWRISRDTYGLGRRFTVIYLANGEQIRDPNRIYPGQVFRVPSDAGQYAGDG